MSVRSESCSCVVRSVAEVEEQGLASRKRKHRQKRYGRARMPRSMSLAPPNKRCKRRDRRDTGESDRGGKTTARFQLARPHGNVGKSAASGLGPRSRKSSLRWKTPWVVNAENLHGSFARSGLGSVGEQVAPLEGDAAGSRRIDRGVRDSIGKGCARKKTPRTSARSIRLSPLTRRETRCGSGARPKGASHKSSSEHGSLKLTCPRGVTSLRSHEARVLAPECDDGRNRFRASRVASVEESQDESMNAKLAQASADPAMTRPAAEA